MICCFFHNGIYMPNRLIFPSDLSAAPQTPYLPAFRLKDMHREMFQPENILQENDSPKIGRTSVRLKHSNPRLKDSQAQSFSRNAHGQGVCGQAEAFEGFFKAFPIAYDKRPHPIEKSKILERTFSWMERKSSFIIEFLSASDNKLNEVHPSSLKHAPKPSIT